MNIELIKLISLVWMGVIAYMLYLMLIDVQYMTQLVHAYIKLAMEIIG